MYKVNNMPDALRELQSECQDFTKNGKCTGCGSCCSNILPMTEEEVGIIRKYIKIHNIKECSHFLPLSNPMIDFTCPFLDDSKKSFILIRAAFRIYEEHLNLNTSTGVISIDMNYDNISWSELNKDGVRLRGHSIYFDLDGKTSNQRKDILGRVCSRIVQLCVDTKKPLVMEDISLQKKKASLAYGVKTANRKTSEFAYQMMTSLLCGKALQRSVGVIKVNPAYTSQIGKMKYMKHMRSTVHLAASYVIGRRGMGFSEKVPAYLKELIPDNKKYSHHWKKYAHLMTVLKNFKVKFFLTEVPIMTDVGQYQNTKYCFS